MFLGVTLFRRQNVGGGLVQFEEASIRQMTRTGITFKAGSLPEPCAWTEPARLYSGN